MCIFSARWSAIALDIQGDSVTFLAALFAVLQRNTIILYSKMCISSARWSAIVLGIQDKSVTFLAALFAVIQRTSIILYGKMRCVYFPLGGVQLRWTSWLTP